MEQNQKPAKPAQQNSEQGNARDPRKNESAGPGQNRSGSDLPSNVGKKNPGHANPAHNTPGHTRKNQPGQHDKGQPGQDQTQSYPGIKGSKARELQQNKPIDEKQIKGNADKNMDAAQRKSSDAEDDVLDMPKE